MHSNIDTTTVFRTYSLLYHLLHLSSNIDILNLVIIKKYPNVPDNGTSAVVL